MSIKEKFKHLKDLLTHISNDLDKAFGGNKAASQRVRTGTVKLEKVAKQYRKESIKNEKATKGSKRPAKKAAKTAHKKAAAKPKTAHKKVVKKKAVARPHALSFRKPTAKLPMRRSAR